MVHKAELIYVIIGMFQTLEHAGNATIALGLIIMH
jgi:hypothetical protein